MANNICPACGSPELERRVADQLISEPFGGERKIPLIEYSCKTCGSSGDFFNDNEKPISDAIESMRHDAIRSILEQFSENKISMSAIERALQLPQRTLTKWKTGGATPTAAGVALMRFIRLFPWLLEVADNGFNYDEAQRIHIKAAVDKLLSSMRFDDKDLCAAGVIATSKSSTVYMRFEKSEGADKAALAAGPPEHIFIDIDGGRPLVSTANRGCTL